MNMSIKRAEGANHCRLPAMKSSTSKGAIHVTIAKAATICLAENLFKTMAVHATSSRPPYAKKRLDSAALSIPT